MLNNRLNGDLAACKAHIDNLVGQNNSVII